MVPISPRRQHRQTACTRWCIASGCMDHQEIERKLTTWPPKRHMKRVGMKAHMLDPSIHLHLLRRDECEDIYLPRSTSEGLRSPPLLPFLSPANYPHSWRSSESSGIFGLMLARGCSTGLFWPLS